MLHCLIYLVIWAIVAAIVLYIIQLVLSQFWPIPPRVMALVGCLIALLLLLYILSCLGLFETPVLPVPPPRR